MPVSDNRRTPGVYITEENAFPPSIVGVQTAIPAFIGYTEKANVAGKPVYLKPIKIGSFDQFCNIFGGGFTADFSVDEITAAKFDLSSVGSVRLVDSAGAARYFTLGPNTAKKFNLYASMKLFYDNGGEECYVVSVGNYTDNGASADGVDVSAANLSEGLTAVADIVGPTLLVIPDAVLLPPDTEGSPECAAFSKLVCNMLAQCAQTQDRIAILDVYGVDTVSLHSATFEADMSSVVDAFRHGVGTENLKYGAAYFPFLNTTAYPVSDVNFTYFDAATLKSVLNAQAEALYVEPALADTKAMINRIDEEAVIENPEKVAELEGKLQNAVPILQEIEALAARALGILPPSGAMAGVYFKNDQSRGVWNAPANVSLASVIAPSHQINNEMQQDLNVPLDGKAIDVIRKFPARGSVVWGARTLMGNSQDWRYIQVRRTVIYIEQSIKAAMLPFVFAANDGKTWATVTSAVSNFLQGTWSQGGLLGDTPDDAFTVECGLGSTMTAQDILEGYMIVRVKLQLIRPGEFIELSFTQKMQEA